MIDQNKIALWDDNPVDITSEAMSCFLMAGGTLLPGREDNDE